MLAGGFLLLSRRRNYSTTHGVLLIMLLAVVSGRLLEQMVGIARVSDLTLFWALLAIFVAVPRVMAGPTPDGDTPLGTAGPAQNPTPSIGAFGAPALWRLLIILVLVAAIFGLTWTKSVNYARAALTAGDINQLLRRGDFSGGLAAADSAISLAPDVFVYHNHRAAVLDAARAAGDPLLAADCARQASIPYQGCLGQEIYKSNRLGVLQRPLHYRARVALAGTTLSLANLTGSPVLADEAVRIHLEALQLMPHSWALWNRLASAFVQIKRPEQALEAAGNSLVITKETENSSSAHCIRGIAFRDLDELEKSVEALGLCLKFNSSGVSAREAHKALAGVYGELGKEDLAKQHLELSQQLNGP